MLDSAQTAKKLLDQRTKDLKSGLKIETQVIYKSFLTGKKTAEDFHETYSITMVRKELSGDFAKVI